MMLSCDTRAALWKAEDPVWIMYEWGLANIVWKSKGFPARQIWAPEK